MMIKIPFIALIYGNDQYQPEMGSSYPQQVCEPSSNRNNKCRPTSRQSKSSERRAEFIAPPPPNCHPPPLAASGQVYKEVYSGLSLPPPGAIASRYKKRQPTASIISNGHHQVNGHHVPNGHSRHQNPSLQTEYSSKNSRYHETEDLMQWNNQSEPVPQVKSKNIRNFFCSTHQSITYFLCQQFSRPPSGVYPASTGNGGKKKISPSLSTPIKSEFNNRHGWEWQMGHPQPQRSSSAHHLHQQRPFSPSASYIPPDIRSASRADMEQFR